MGTYSSFEVLSVSGALILALYGAYNIVAGKRTNLPPGPPADPLVGHLLRMPRVSPEKKFQEWHKTYGQLSFMNVLALRWLTIKQEISFMSTSLDHR